MSIDVQLILFISVLAMLIFTVTMVMYFLPYQYFRPELIDSNNRKIGRVWWIAGRKKGILYTFWSFSSSNPVGNIMLSYGPLMIFMSLPLMIIEHQFSFPIGRWGTIIGCLVLGIGGLLNVVFIKDRKTDPRRMPLVKYHFNNPQCHIKPEVVIYFKESLFDLPKPIYYNGKKIVERAFFTYIGGDTLQYHRNEVSRLNHYEIISEPEKKCGFEDYEYYTHKISQSLETNIQMVLQALQQDSHLMKDELKTNTFTNAFILDRKAFIDMISDITEGRSTISKDQYQIIDSLCEKMGYDTKEILELVTNGEISIQG